MPVDGTAIELKEIYRLFTYIRGDIINVNNSLVDTNKEIDRVTSYTR